MNQAKEQFVFDLQMFADEAAGAAGAVETPSEEASATETDTNVKSIGEMSEVEQTDFVKKTFFKDDNDEPNEPNEVKGEKAEPPQSQVDKQPQERKVKLTHNGQEVEVSESEARNLAMQGYDYTKKMQQLAAERRHYEQLIAQMTAPKPEEKPKENPLDVSYNAAIATAEKMLGISPGDFNQFDPKHQYVLQQVAAQEIANRQEQEHARQAFMREREEVMREVQEFDKVVRNDPMTEQVMENFEKFIFRLCTDEKGVMKAAEVANSYQRYLEGKLAPNDCKVLRGHWDFVKGELSKNAPAKVKPPRTESPGTGTGNSLPKVLNKSRVRELADNPDAQMKYLRSVGIFD